MLEYIDNGDLANAYASMCSDLAKHEKTKDHIKTILGMELIMSNNLNTVAKMREFIEGFN